MANLVVSELTTLRTPPADGLVSSIVTTFAAGLATVKSACVFIAVKILSAVVLLSVFGLNPVVDAGADDPAASDVNVTVVPSDFVNINVVPTAMFA